MTGYLEGILVVLCINAVLGYAAYLPLSIGQINLGIAGFMAIGAYTSAIVTNELGFPLVLGLLTAIAAAALAATLIAYPVLRTTGIYLAFATFALNEIVRSLFLNIELVGGAAGYPVAVYSGVLFPAAVAAVVTVLMIYSGATRAHIVLASVRSDEAVSDLFGVNIRLVQLIVFVVSAGLAGAGGSLYGHYFSFIEAQHFTVFLSITTILYVVVGGTRSVWGPIVGASIYTLLPELLRDSGEWRFVIFSALIIAFIAFRPEGIVAPRSSGSAGLVARLVGRSR